MAFGLLKTKWQILCKALDLPLAESPIIFQVCCMLHGCCINERLQLGPELNVQCRNFEDSRTMM